jgi:hypothetical protein
MAIQATGVAKIPRLLRCIAVLLAALLPGLLGAHPLAPVLLQLDIREDGRVDVTWKTSLLIPVGSDLRPQFPDHCKALSAPEGSEQATYAVVRWQLDCGSEGLEGHVLGVSGLVGSNLNTLVRINDPLQGSRSWLLKAEETTQRVDEAPGKLAVAKRYLQLGAEHLVFGPDHVLLIIAMMLLISGWRSLLITITAFTLGHSITLCLATLGVVSVPTYPIEVAIAFSIMLVAASIPRDSDAAPRAAARAPWLVALVFGLLHGFGFAGALSAVGLPAAEIPLALFSFNVGIELGQIAIVLLGWWVLRSWTNHTDRGRIAVTYAIGGLAGFWTLQRLLLISQV